jgi:hypothetical protein
MKTIKENVNHLRETMLEGMIANFKKDGCLLPVFFYLRNNQPYMSIIPEEFLSSIEGKVRLSQILRQICKDQRVSAIGFIYEAYLAKTERGSHLGKLLESGNLRVADLNIKQDVIVMHFATTECQEAIIFPVDVKNITIGERFNLPDAVAEGFFANLFQDAA